MLDEQKILSLTRPHPILMTHYLIQSVFSGPLIIFVLPVMYFRYHTMKYRFDPEGVHKEWGILFHKEVNLTWQRIQDIHVTSGPIQRWLGLADLQIQTASGSSSAEMTIEGFPEHEAIRDYLYSKMRGAKGTEKKTESEPAAPESEGAGEALTLLREIGADLKAVNEALASRPDTEGPSHV